ncbi:MAG: SRPBCC family protein [Gemmatimonadetes bacterium]|nr:SRPBCC family protein [Gemmatimonadota bacterium]MBI2536691.1 SRPBCC family protein [Gemmatimonadota bacterium]
MHIEKRFVVQAAPDVVWRFLADPHKVAGCLPGAAITGQVDERTYAGTITVKVGPVATSYRGQVRFERLDAAAGTAEIVASGQDVRGKGGADMRMTSRVAERGRGETEVTVAQEINVTGILAQMGRGMIQDVGDQLFEKFTAAMRGHLESAATPAPAVAEPIQVVSLGAGVAGRALRRAARRPAVWALVMVGLVVLWWLLRRVAV